MKTRRAVTTEGISSLSNIIKTAAPLKIGNTVRKKILRLDLDLKILPGYLV
jgi:hypothetical protein